MTTVETAKGPIDSAELGRVLMHEHVFVISTEIQQNHPEEWGSEEARVTNAADRLTELKAAGIDTILDPTALGLGRYVPRIVEVARRIDLNIVVATGLYTFNELPHYYKRREPEAGGLDAMTAHLSRIVGYVEQLSELDTDAIEPMAHAMDIANVFVADEVRASLDRGEAH